jgi:hypothetical protein
MRILGPFPDLNVDSARQSVATRQIHDSAFRSLAAIKISCEAACRDMGRDVSQLLAGYPKDLDGVRINGIIQLAFQDQFFAHPALGYEALAGPAVFIAMRTPAILVKKDELGVAVMRSALRTSGSEMLTL